MDENKTKKLKMTFDPNTIQHLGIKMYAYLPDAIAELVANAYDACATKVEIKLYDDGSNKKIIVNDDGDGMSFDELNNKFLIIGRNRREEGLKETSCKRIATGKKGLGKLALFGIGGQIDIETTKEGEDIATKLSLVWEDLKNWNREKQGPDYKPIFEINKCDKDAHGTIISISILKRKTNIDDKYIKDTATSLSKLFNFLDDGFKVEISLNDGDAIAITNDLKYENLIHQFEWILPEYSKEIDSEYEEKLKINGTIFTTPTPLSNKKQTGVTLFAHGRRVNEAEFFDHIESSNFFSYATGWLNVDFVDDCDEELISTDRKSIDWEDEKMIKLRSFLKMLISKIHSDWRIKRKEENKNKLGKESDINKDKWLATLPPDKAKTINEALEEVADPDSKRNPVDVLFETSHNLAPEYAEKHWRYLHQKITSDDAIDRLYQSKNYFQAASEAAKLYIKEVRLISSITTAQERSDYTLMGQAFGWNDIGRPSKIISLTDRSDVIEKDIEQGQRHYSEGVVCGFKNPVTSHATETELKDRGLFSEKDCLDILSLLSHMFDRLDKRKTPR